MLSPEQTEQKKQEFLSAFPTCKISSDACRAIGITRGVFEHWKRSDPDFLKTYEGLELDVIDDAKRMAYQKTGILPMQPGTSTKWINDNLLIALLKRDPSFKDNAQITINQPAPLEIKGIDAKILIALATPDKPELASEAVAEIPIEGVSRRAPVPKSLEKAVAAKAAAETKTEDGIELEPGDE